VACLWQPIERRATDTGCRCGKHKSVVTALCLSCNTNHLITSDICTRQSISCDLLVNFLLAVHKRISKLFLLISRVIQNIPDWCCHLYSSCGLWILGSTAKFCGDFVKTCEDFAPNFGEYIPGCCTNTTPRLTLPFSPSSFWRSTIGCHPPHIVLAWYGTSWLLPMYKN
jgi:hypothetical protein